MKREYYNGKFSYVKALTFDLFGTVLDLGGSLTPHIDAFLKSKGMGISPDQFWERWRYRQRIEQYQDTLMMLGHSGYLETARRAFVDRYGLPYEDTPFVPNVTVPDFKELADTIL